MEEIVIRVGDFLKEHINNIVNMCNNNPTEFENLQNVEYAKTTFGLRANYSFFKKLSLFNDNPNIRYYAQDYYINGEKYRLTSQFGGNAIIEGKTTSQYQGEKIYEYLKIYNLLLDKYENKKIIFIAVNNNENTINQENNFALKFNPLNQILYGSPGTGKTYNTINKAIEIIDSDFYQQNREDREALKERFEEYKKSGQIEFITFHQSFSYEEFVEGIKAETKDENISYEVKAGIFKKLCEKAMGKENNNFNEKIEWLKAECSEADNKSLHIDTFTVTYRDGKTFRIKPDKSKNSETDYPASIENIEKIYKGGLRKEVYNPTYVVGILNYLYDNGLTKYDEIKEDNTKNYILIIDEINRGNLSKIFGELLMLIEKDYRDTEIKLAYNGEMFCVPSNLYIIGMMNTADRSLAMIDYALRRRFSFYEMTPGFDTEGFKKYQESIGNDKFDKVVNAIVSLNHDIINDDSLGSGFCIGHSYFCSSKPNDINDLWLENIVEYDIKPMLREYWFDNDSKYQTAVEKLLDALK